MDTNVAFSDAVARARQIAAKLSAGAPAGGPVGLGGPPSMPDKTGNPNTMPLGMKRGLDEGAGGPDTKRFVSEDAIGAQLRAIADQQRMYMGGLDGEQDMMRNDSTANNAARAAAAAAAQVAAKLNRSLPSDNGLTSKPPQMMSMSQLSGGAGGPGGGGMPPGMPITENYSIPDRMVGLVIGKGGEQISRLQQDSGCKVQIAPDSGGRPDRPCTLTGSYECVEKVKRLINDIIRKAQVAGTPETIPDGQTLLEMYVPGTKVGLVIGKGGETIKMLQEQSGCRLVMVQDSSLPSDVDKPLRITGDPESVEEARRLVQDLLDSKDALPPGQGGSGFGEYGARPASQPAAQEELQRKPMIGGGGEVIMVPKPCVGVVIGKGGDMIKRLETDFSVRIQFRPDDGAPERACQVSGPPDAVFRAMAAIQQICEDSNRADGMRRNRGGAGGGAPGMNRGPGGQQGMSGGNRPGGPRPPFGDGYQDAATMNVPADKCGIVIGKGGETIREICRIAGAHVELQRQPSANPAEKIFDIRGNPEQIQHAMTLIAEKAGIPPPGSLGGSGHLAGPGGMSGHGGPQGPGSWGPPGSGGPGGPQQQPWGPPGYGGAPPAPQPAWGGGYNYNQWGGPGQGQGQGDQNHEAWQAYYAQYYQQTPQSQGPMQGQLPMQQSHPQMQQQQQQPQQQQQMQQPQQQQPQQQAQPQQQQQPQQQAQAAPTATINPATGQPDYSEAWAAYYRSLGYHEQAEAILAQARQPGQQGTAQAAQ